jgi:hypothetical protein
MDNNTNDSKTDENIVKTAPNEEKLLEATIPSNAPTETIAAPVAPSQAPAAPVMPRPESTQVSGAGNQHSTPLTLLVQWLMYAFYGWTILALNYLIGSDIFHYLGGNSTSSLDGAAIYAVTASLVLLAIAVTANLVYAKREPQQKSGAASAIMIIHALIFAILGILSLIAAVFILVAFLMNSSGDGKAAFSGIATAIFSFLLYAMAFVRTINPLKFKWVNKAYLYSMLGLTGVFVVLSIIGPVAASFKGKNDVLIDNNIYSISDAINQKASTDGALPTSLSSVMLSGDSKLIVDRNLVTYIPNSLTNSNQYEFYYELCATYARSSAGYKNSDARPQDPTRVENYSLYPDFNMHPSGKYCYLIYTDGNGIMSTIKTSSSSGLY